MEPAIAIPLAIPLSDTPPQEGVSAAEKDGTPAAQSEDERIEQARKTVEIRITMDSDDGALLKIMSIIKQREGFPAPAAPQNLNLRAPTRDEALAPVARRPGRVRASYVSPLSLLAALLLGFVFRTQIGDMHLPQLPSAMDARTSIQSLVDRIIGSESRGDPAAKNPHSSAVGLGQFVEGTWLDLIKRHRPDLAQAFSERQILDLRKDPGLSRFMTSRYVEQNSSILARRGLPVTPGSLYLAHFAGAGGAAAILQAPENADAAGVIADADGKAGITREKILTGNPFMKNFTARDLRNWAELKMKGLTLDAAVEEDGAAPRLN